jgi:ubiquinone/menaquinone biosynthesis C-methylase UbiE
MYGSEKKYFEKNPLKKIGYALLGELHVPGRLRAYHVLRKLKKLGLTSMNGLRVLDAGCGRGDLVVSFARKFPHWQVRGIELDKERLDIAKLTQEKLGLHNLTLIHGNLLELEIPDKFDLVTCCDVLEHIEDDVAVMKTFFTVLKNDGELLLTFPSTPQRKHLGLVKWREERIGFSNEDYGHVREGYSVEGITATLKDIGFREIACEYTFGFWGTLSFDLFFVIGDNKPNLLAFLLAFPFLMLTAMLDLYFPSRQGSALLVVARK